MNKKGQAVITVFFSYIVFIIVWLAGFGEYLSIISEIIMSNPAITGVEALFYSNLNLVVFMAVTLSLIGWAAFIGDGQ